MRWFWLILLVACGGGGDGEVDSGASIPPDTAQSGTRLKLFWYEFEDGTRSWTSEIFDSKLGLPCTPTEWTDGASRCTPMLPRVVYSDAQCTQPMILGTDVPHAVARVTSCQATRPDSLFEATAERLTLPQVFERDPDGACGRLYSPRQFSFSGVRAVQQTRPDLAELSRGYQGDGRVKIETLSSDDGLLLPIQPYDSLLDAACVNFDSLFFNTEGMADATRVPCLLDASETERFTDITCETPAVWFPVDAACPRPQEFGTVGKGPCAPRFTLGDTAQGGSYGTGTGTCLPQGPDSGVVYPSTGMVEPFSLARERQDAPGRLQLIYIGEGATRIRERVLFYDTALDTECALRQEDVETFSCVPVRGRSVFEVYTDDACTQPVFVTWIADEQAPACLAVQTPPKYSGGRRIEGMLPEPVYRASAAGCARFEFDNASPYALGPPVTTALPRVTKRHD